ncbi:MAG: hypothetical protein JWO80_12 [Bryobacterales bacterium]|nr:hypothetical protein [Bryobacterales bacterium]
MNTSMDTIETDKAFRYLVETSENVVNAVKDLDGAQWTFKPAPDRWSIGEVVEHLGVVEGYFQQNVVPRLRDAPAPPADRDPQHVDGLVLAMVDGPPFGAPPQILPSGRWTPQESLREFLEKRNQTAAFLHASAAEHRQHALPHPAFGVLDGYQWVLFIAVHSARHAKQILVVKADPAFPTN